MSWQTLGTVTPREDEWSDYDPTTQAPSSPVESIFYRLSGLNVAPLDPDRFYALVRFKFGADFTPAFRHIPRTEPQLSQVDIPPEITAFPFSWVPQIRLVYMKPTQRPEPIAWAVRIDEFIGPDVQAEALVNLQKFLY
jgi:hypothetical protein